MKTTNFHSLKQEVTEQTETFSPSLSLLPSVKVLFFVGFALLTLSAPMHGQNLTSNSTADGNFTVGYPTEGNLLINGKTGGSAGNNFKVIGEGLVIFQDPSGVSALTWNPMKGSLSLGSGNFSNKEGAFVGSDALVLEDYGFAFGYGAMAGGFGSIAMGEGAFADVGAIAIGNGGAYAGGFYSLALGSAQADGDYSVALNGWAAGAGSTAFHGALAEGSYSFAAIYGTTSGNYSTSIGQGTQADSAYSTVLGRYNIIAGNSTAWVSTDDLLVLGNGTGTGARRNALTVLKNGKMSLFPTSSNTSSIVLDPNTPQITVGNQTVLLANSSGNVGIGTSSPSGKFEVAGGGGTPTTGDLLVNNNSVVIGRLSPTGGDNTVFQVRDRLGTITMQAGGGATDSILGTPAGGSVIFKTQATERARFDASGNFGIGTTSPTFRLETAGAANFGDGPFIKSGSVKDTRYYDQQTGAYFHTPGAMVRKDSSTTNMAQAPATLVLYNKDGTDNTGAKLAFAANETTSSSANPVALAAIASQKVSGINGTWATGNLKFLVKSGQFYVDVATMRASGNVGIGQDNPTAKLDVNGDIKAAAIQATVVRVQASGDLSMGEFTN